MIADQVSGNIPRTETDRDLIRISLFERSESVFLGHLAALSSALVRGQRSLEFSSLCVAIQGEARGEIPLSSKDPRILGPYHRSLVLFFRARSPNIAQPWEVGRSAQGEIVLGPSYEAIPVGPYPWYEARVRASYPWYEAPYEASYPWYEARVHELVPRGIFFLGSYELVRSLRTGTYSRAACPKPQGRKVPTLWFCVGI